MSAESESADVFDFVDAYLSDLERGVDRPLAYWLERFPRSTEAVAREWIALRDQKCESTATPAGASGSFEDGTARIGPYRLIRELGRGGQGTVFLAEDTRIARRVALKALTSRFESISDEKRQRFRREAEVIARLEHPGLCTIHDADLDGDSPWIAMRFVEGRTLAECLGDARATGGGEIFGLRLPPTNATEVHALLFLVERAARALHAAHEAGVIHRDVKPGNVIVTLDGRPVVLDFGLARDETSATGTLTQSGDVFGTPAYMSPEQLTSPSSALDRRTDVYSLGALAYEALTLERPFERASRTASYRAILEDPTPDPRKVNPALSEDVKVVLETALDKDRGRRYATALDLAEDLRRIREYEPIHARPASVGLRFARWMRRHPAIAAATLGTIAALSIGLVVSLRLLANERAALRHALGRQLALRVDELALEDPPRALAVGLEAITRAETDLTRGSLFTALDACWLERYVDPGTAVEGKAVTAIATARHASTAAVAWENGLVWVTDLDARSGGRAVRAEGASPASDLALAADGATLALATLDGTVEVRDLKDGTTRLARTFPEGRSEIALAPDGLRLLATDAQGVVHVLALDARELDVTLDGGAREFRGARFSPDGTQVLALSAKRGLVVADARDGRVERALHPADVTAFDAVGAGAGARAFVACADRTLRVVDLAEGRESRAPLAFEGDLERVVARRDGTVAIVIAADGEEGWAYWCDLATGATRRLEEHAGRRVTEAAFGPDGTRFATSSWDTTVRLWDARTGEHLRACMVTRRQLDVAWDDDGERLVTRAITGPALVWYARVRPDLFDLDGHAPGVAITSVGFSRDGRRAVSASEDGTARVWDVDPADAKGLGRPLVVVRHDGPVRVAAFADEDRVLVTSSDDGTVGVWSTVDGRPMRARATHAAALLGTAVDPRGEHFATWTDDGATRLWPARADGAPAVVAGAPSHVACAAFSPDGARLALGGVDDEIVIVDARDARVVGRSAFERKWSGGGVSQIAVSGSGAEIVATCGDQFLRRFALGASGGLTETSRLKSINAVELRLDATGGLALLRSRFGRGAVNVLDLASGRARSPHVSHSADLTSAVFSPAGDYVMTTSKDGTARVWRTQDFVPFARRGGFAGSVTCGDLSGTGAQLRAITGTSTGRVAVWPIDPAPAARARMPRELSAAERRLEAELAAPLEFR